MAFSYSNHHSPGGTLHLSPTHIHHIDSLTAVSDLRRSLSRSPSKHPHFTPARQVPTPGQLSAAATTQRSPKMANLSTTPENPPPRFSTTPLARFSSTPLAPVPDVIFPSSAKKTRPSYKRSTPLRMLSHTPAAKTPSRTPMRRALSDAHGNTPITNSQDYRGEGQENSSSPDLSPVDPPRTSNDGFPGTPFVKGDHIVSPFNFTLTPSQDNIGKSARFSKSSPLKRSEAHNNLDRSHLGSPGGKRKTVSGGFSSSPAFNLASNDQMMLDAPTKALDGEDTDDELTSNDVMGSPPPSRLFSLRRSSRIADRPHMRSRRSVDATSDIGRSPRMYAKTRSRASLDSGLPMSMSTNRNLFNPDDTFSPMPKLYDTFTSHPTTTLSPIAPSPPKEEEQAAKNDDAVFQKPALPKLNFSRSLPIGAVRPKPRSLRGIPDLSENKDFATPEAYKYAKPHPAAFMSTGLISKRHRNPDDMPAPPGHHGMPDTPCKKNPLGFGFQSSPIPAGPTSKLHFPQPSFGTPSKPFNIHSTRGTPIFGKSTNVFGSSFTPSHASLDRKASFASITSLDNEETSHSPLHLAHMDSQSSADELPPTPTKHDARPKPNSLRSKLLGRRPAMNSNTFLPPSAAEEQSLQTSCKSTLTSDVPSTLQLSPESAVASSINSPGFSVSTSYSAWSRIQQKTQTALSQSPLGRRLLRPSRLNPHSSNSTKIPSPTTVFAQPGSSGGMSPKTPAEGNFSFPDPSNLSISPRLNHPSTPFLTPGPHHPLNHPPETPTHRDSAVHAQQMSVTPSNHAFGQDVDPALASRFKKVELYGRGEFSEVFKVYELEANAVHGYSFGLNFSQTQPVNRVYIVKKSRSPFISQKLMQKKLREVKAMQEIGSSEHIVQLINHWDANHHLYIQLEFCEEGNLEEFLFKEGLEGRLDDFRIWKILIELCDGIKQIHDANFVHLDLKPANIFISFAGVLKIGDFGMAAKLPIQDDIEGEGDRRYIGPDLLQGRFDKPADIFALGMIMFEIATNTMAPDNGASWQKLRAGEWSELPCLTKDPSAPNCPPEHLNVAGTPEDEAHTSHESLYKPTQPGLPTMTVENADEVYETEAPSFMVSAFDDASLDGLVQWMMAPNPDHRPTIDQLLPMYGMQWVRQRRRSGATIFEGKWGPSALALTPSPDERQDAEMLDA